MLNYIIAKVSYNDLQTVSLCLRYHTCLQKLSIREPLSEDLCRKQFCQKTASRYSSLIINYIVLGLVYCTVKTVIIYLYLSLCCESYYPFIISSYYPIIRVVQTYNKNSQSPFGPILYVF